MFPAMDRVSKPTANRLRLGLAIVMASALGSSQLGCSKLQSLLREKPEPPLIGQIRDTRDIYAGAHGPSTPQVAATTPIPPRASSTSPSNPALAVEDDPEPPIFRAIDASAPLDAVQPAAATRPSAASIGVPDGARLIASASRGTSPAKLVKEAREALDRLASYQVALHRQERVDGNLLPEEDVILAVRREPLAIRLTWAEGVHKGREVLYRADEPGSMMHVNPGGILPRMSLSPTSPLVMRNSRHPVTEAGFESLVSGLEAALARPDTGGLALAGTTHPVLVRTTSEGETWQVTIDPTTHLPELVECTSGQGDLLERYSFRDLRADLPELATADAFDPTARWGATRGLFGRLSGATGPPR